MSASDATGFPILTDKTACELADSRAIAPSRSGEPDDEALLVQLQAGEMDALGLLFHRYSRLLLGIARRVLQDGNEAEDLVQDVFLFLFYKGKAFDPAKGLARSWLMQVTYHRAYDRRRIIRTTPAERCGNVSDRAADESPEDRDFARFDYGNQFGSRTRSCVSQWRGGSIILIGLDASARIYIARRQSVFAQHRSEQSRRKQFAVCDDLVLQRRTSHRM